MSHFCVMYMAVLLPMVICNADSSSECGRHRKPWHLSTTEEQMLYVRGFKELRNNGQLEVFIDAHHLADTPISFADVHYTAEFFPWHSYFLTELETQIRNLGGEFTCFALPYWDFTNDAGHDIANDMPIYNSLLGSDGNVDDFCVEHELWNREVYPTTYLCSEQEKVTGINCCLKRHHSKRGHIPDADTLVPHIYNYRKWRNFQDAVVKEHTYVHVYLSANDNRTHIFGHNAAEDPLFVMLHNFIMYIRALRTTCFGYDKVINQLEEYQPYAYDPYEASRMADVKPFLDLPMDFNVLSKAKWSRAYKEDITVRKIFDLKEFDITYELGTFWHDNVKLQEFCGSNLNETWFYDSIQYDSENNNFVIGLFSDETGFKSSINHHYDMMYILVFVVFLSLVIVARFRNKLWDYHSGSLKDNDCDNDYGTF